MNRSEGQWEQLELSVPATRGIRSNKVNTQSLGSHWTTDEGVADYFQRKGSIRMPYQGTASIKAEIPFGSLESNSNVLNSKRVGDTQRHEGGPLNEHEVTARSGAPVKVKSITTVGPKKSTRISKVVEKEVGEVSPNVDYQRPGDEDILNRGYKTLQRSRTRTYNPAREMKA